MWRLLCESSQGILRERRSSAPPSGLFIIDVFWKKKRWGFFLVGYLGKSYFLTVNIRVPFIFDQWGGLLTGLRFLVYVVNSVWNSYPVHHTVVTGINLNNIYLFQISCIVMLFPCFSAASVIHQIIVQLVRCKIHLCTQCLYFLFLWIVGGLLSLCFK